METDNEIVVSSGKKRGETIFPPNGRDLKSEKSFKKEGKNFTSEFSVKFVGGGEEAVTPQARPVFRRQNPVPPPKPKWGKGFSSRDSKNSRNVKDNKTKRVFLVIFYRGKNAFKLFGPRKRKTSQRL